MITISISLTFGISNCRFYRYDIMLLIAEYHITFRVVLKEVLQATFSNTFLKMSICLVEFNCSVFPMIYWKINQHWSGNCLVLNSQHVTTDRYQWWHWCISTPLSLNGLKCHFADIFKWIFIIEKMNLWVQFHRSEFLMVQLTEFPVPVARERRTSETSG